MAFQGKGSMIYTWLEGQMCEISCNVAKTTGVLFLSQ